MSVMHGIILGIILSSAAVIGDLIESLFKREAGVKDSGRFFPGIGGILDLLDSLLFNAPLMYLYLRHVLSNPSFAHLLKTCFFLAPPAPSTRTPSMWLKTSRTGRA